MKSATTWQKRDEDCELAARERMLQNGSWSGVLKYGRLADYRGLSKIADPKVLLTRQYTPEAIAEQWAIKLVGALGDLTDLLYQVEC